MFTLRAFLYDFSCDEVAGTGRHGAQVRIKEKGEEKRRRTKEGIGSHDYVFKKLASMLCMSFGSISNISVYVNQR